MADTREDLEAEAARLAMAAGAKVNAIEKLTDTAYPDVRVAMVEAVSRAVHKLAQRDDDHQTEVIARKLCTFLFGKNHPPAEFWATITGQNVAWAIGYPLPAAPILAAAAVLQLTRQMVHKLSNSPDCPLTRVDGGIGAESLRLYARRRTRTRVYL